MKQKYNVHHLILLTSILNTLTNYSSYSIFSIWAINTKLNWLSTLLGVEDLIQRQLSSEWCTRETKKEEVLFLWESSIPKKAFPWSWIPSPGFPWGLLSFWPWPSALQCRSFSLSMLTSTWHCRELQVFNWILGLQYTNRPFSLCTPDSRDGHFEPVL